MIVIEYKIACEVHVIHDYYLIGSTNTSFFSQDRATQQSVLHRKLQNAQYNINNDIQFLISRKDAEIMQNYKLRLLSTPLGFNLAIEVNSEPGPAGGIRYRPAIPLPEELTLTLGIATNSSTFGSITNARLRENDGKIYKFSNDGPRVAGTLSSPIGALESGRQYQMGDHARIDGVVQQAIEDNAGNRTKFERIAANGFVSEEDRIVDTTSNTFKDWLLGLSTVGSRPFGLIELRFHTANINQSIVDEDGFLITRRSAGQRRPVPQRFELRFLSKRTYWCYLKREGFTPEEIDYINLKASTFLALQEGKFVTREPRFTSRSFTGFDGSITQFPNPVPSSLRKTGSRLFSDVYFNKMNPIP